MWPGLGPRWAGREHTAEGSWCPCPSALLAALRGMGSPSSYLSRGLPRSRMPWFAQGFESTGNGPGGQPEPRPPGDPGASPQGRQVGVRSTGPQLFRVDWAPHPAPLPGKTGSALPAGWGGWGPSRWSHGRMGPQLEALTHMEASSPPRPCPFRGVCRTDVQGAPHSQPELAGVLGSGEDGPRKVLEDPALHPAGS